MFGKGSNWTDKLREKLTAYVDERFEEYRERIAEDLSQGLATLAGLIVFWTIVVICFVFGAVVLSLLLAEAYRPLVGTWAYLSGFFTVALVVGGIGWWLIQNKIRVVEKPVYLDMLKSLRGAVPKVAEEVKPATEKTSIPKKEKMVEKQPEPPLQKTVEDDKSGKQ